MMSFTEIGERLGISAEVARLTHIRAMAKLRTHIMDTQDFKEDMQNGTNSDAYARLVASAVELGSVLDRPSIRADVTAAQRKLKMAYRNFVKGQER